MFGNTRRVADAISAGIGEGAEVTVLGVDDAPRFVPDGVDLVVVGGPTHAFSMSRDQSRADADGRGAVGRSTTGIREWIAALGQGSSAPDYATFDTHVRQRWVPGAASTAAARALRGRGRTVIASESFRVDDIHGPLLAGEEDRACEWGRQLRATRAGRVLADS